MSAAYTAFRTMLNPFKLAADMVAPVDHRLL
jgi:hypothetical protein